MSAGEGVKQKIENSRFYCISEMIIDDVLATDLPETLGLLGRALSLLEMDGTGCMEPAIAPDRISSFFNRIWYRWLK